MAKNIEIGSVFFRDQYSLLVDGGDAAEQAEWTENTLLEGLKFISLHWRMDEWGV